MYKLNFDAESYGTYYLGDFECSYQKLVQKFGEPSGGDDYKVTMEWVFEGPAGVFTLYDWKSSNRYEPDYPSVEELQSLPKFTWHIGGRGQMSHFVHWLTRELRDE